MAAVFPTQTSSLLSVTVSVDIMKKLLFLVIALSMGVSVFAQSESGLGINAGAGIIMAKQKGSTTMMGTTTNSTTSGPGFYVNFGFNNDLGLGGLGYTMDLFFDHWALSDDAGTSDAVARENYIGFAMAINISLDASETLSLQPFFGPGFSWGLSSKTDWTNPISGNKETTDNYDEDTHYLRQYSYLTVGADVLLKSLHLRLRGAVDFGMWDRYSSVKEITAKDGPNLRLGVAYLF